MSGIRNSLEVVLTKGYSIHLRRGVTSCRRDGTRANKHKLKSAIIPKLEEQDIKE